MTNPPPTQVRYLVVATATLMSVLLYLDRFCISFLEMYVQQDLGLSNTQVGWMLSAFFWTYALGQVPSGWLTDRFGSRIMLTLYVLAWSLFTGLTGVVSVFAALLAIRIGFGFAQAGAYPTASSMVSKWVPLSQRGTASGVIALGGRLGGFLALFATGYLLVALTPGETTSSLSEADLLDGRSVCEELVQAQRSPTDGADELRAKCFLALSSAGRSLVEDVGQSATSGAASAELELDSNSAEPRALSTQERNLLISEMNGLIQSTQLFSRADVANVSVEKEVHRLFERQSVLTPQEQARLNRLILEGLHTTGIKKLYVAGWRPVMMLYGSLGIFVAGIIWWSCRTTPAEHPRANAAEVALIAGSTIQQPSTTLSGVPWRGLFASRSMWCSCVTQWFTNIGWVFLMTWAPRYYTSVHGISTEERALLVSIPPLFGWAGMLVGGATTDWAASRIGLRWGRALPVSLSRFLAMSAYLCCLLGPGPYMAAALFATVAFATALGTAPIWAFTQDVGGRHVGSVLGWGNMWGNLGAAITPPLLIWIVGEAENWNYAFIACATAFSLSGIAALGINAAIQIVPDPPERASEPDVDSGQD